MRSDRPHGEVEGTQAHRPLTLPESDLDGAGRRWWMHDPSAGRPGLKLDAPTPGQSADHAGRQQAANACQSRRGNVNRRSRIGVGRRLTAGRLTR